MKIQKFSVIITKRPKLSYLSKFYRKRKIHKKISDVTALYPRPPLIPRRIISVWIFYTIFITRWHDNFPTIIVKSLSLHKMISTINNLFNYTWKYFEKKKFCQVVSYFPPIIFCLHVAEWNLLFNIKTLNVVEWDKNVHVKRFRRVLSSLWIHITLMKHSETKNTLLRLKMPYCGVTLDFLLELSVIFVLISP